MSLDWTWSNKITDHVFTINLEENFELPRVKIYRDPAEISIECDNYLKDKNISIEISKDAATEKEDYSLWSYMRYFQCYRSLEYIYCGITRRCYVKKLLRKMLLTLLVALWIAYVGAVHIMQADIPNENYWCDGEGFLLVITCIPATGLLYIKVFKPFVGRKCFKFLKNWMKENKGCQKINNHFTSGNRRLAAYTIFLLGLTIFIIIDTKDDRSRLISASGILVLLLFGFIFSAAPRKVVWRHVIWGMGMQFAFGLLILRWSTGRSVFECFGKKVRDFLQFTQAGSSFVFGELVSVQGVFAFKVLSVILFFSFCIQILYYYGAMQWILINTGWLLQITIGTTACESVSAAANIFLGQTDAALLIKPYLSNMTKSELHAVLTGGFATIAGGALAAYISFGIDPAHLLSASFMSAPAALSFSKLFYPEVETSTTNVNDIKVDKGSEANVLHAAVIGVATAIPLIANIAANLIAFIAFVAFLDGILNWLCVLGGVENDVCTLANIFGYVFMPLAWIIGVPWVDCYYVGQLIGTKTMINEFVGYLKLASYVKNNEITKRSQIISTYALCGFNNIGSIGIQLGGIGVLAPERRGDIAQIVIRSMIAGSVACFLTACVAGTLLSADDAYLTSGIFNSSFSTISTVQL